jgi:hypothetical protein
MSKRRKCRYSAEELAVHEEAVRLRKLTDKQLVEEFHRAAEAEIAVRVPEMAQEASDEADPNENTPAVQKLLSALSEGKCKGIKGATVYKITEFATEMGLI